MSAASVLARGRVAAAALMVDTCIIEHPTGPGATDLVTGVVTVTYATVYTGPCRLSRDPRMPGVSSGEVAEAHLAKLSSTLSVPMSVVGVVEGDRVTMLTSAHDPELAGAQMRVMGPVHGTFLTARRFEVVEATS